eukprot:gene28551-31875_t
MRFTLPLIALVLAAPAQLQAQSMKYPETRRVPQVDEQFGVKVADPYRWLENDVRTDAEVAKWVADENAVTNAYLATLPGRDIFAARLKQLLNYERFGVPVKKGGRYFYTRNAGLQNQAVLYVRDSVNGEGRVLVDPNTWSKDGATALAEWLTVLWLTPAMDRLFVEPAGERRRFLDRLTLALAPGHAVHANRYEAAMRARNRLLADDGPPDREWLSALEAQMAEHGAAIDAARRDTVAALAERLAGQVEGPFAR